jgi:peptidoglycan hydrolase CwlO-like protein
MEFISEYFELIVIILLVVIIIITFSKSGPYEDKHIAMMSYQSDKLDEIANNTSRTGEIESAIYDLQSAVEKINEPLDMDDPKNWPR